MGWCDAPWDFLVPADLEGRLVQHYGAQLRGSASQHNAECMAGDNRFWDMKDSIGLDDACQAAWDSFGPTGIDAPGYLIENPFSD